MEEDLIPNEHDEVRKVAPTLPHIQVVPGFYVFCAVHGVVECSRKEGRADVAAKRHRAKHFEQIQMQNEVDRRTEEVLKRAREQYGDDLVGNGGIEVDQVVDGTGKVVDVVVTPVPCVEEKVGSVRAAEDSTAEVFNGKDWMKVDLQGVVDGSPITTMKAIANLIVGMAEDELVKWQNQVVARFADPIVPKEQTALQIAQALNNSSRLVR